MTSYNTDSAGEPIIPTNAVKPGSAVPAGLGSFVFTPKTLDEFEMLAMFQQAWETYTRKNADYGNSWKKKGSRGVLVRWADKLERLDNLHWRGNAAQVKDEAIGDTIKDALIYNLMCGVLFQRGEYDGPK